LSVLFQSLMLSAFNVMTSMIRRIND